MEININTETLNEEINLLSSINDDFSDLYTAMSEISLEGIELESATVFEEAKTTVKNVINGDTDYISMGELQDRIKNVRDILVNSNSNMSSLFSDLDEMSLEEFGNYEDYQNNVETTENSTDLIFEDNQEEIFTYSVEETSTEYVKIEEVTMEDGTTYQINIIGEVTEDTPVILLDHGAGKDKASGYHAGGDQYANGNNVVGDQEYDYAYLDMWINSEEVENVNAVVVRYNRAFNPNADTGIKILKDVTSKYNIPIENCYTAGFSAGGEHSLKQAADIIRESDSESSNVLMLVDGYLQTKPSRVVSNEDLEILGNENTVLFAINQPGITCDVPEYENWKENYNVNVIRIVDNYCAFNGAKMAHHGTMQNYLNLGLLEFQSGQGKFPTGGFEDKDGVYHNYYDGEIYNGEEWVPINLEGKTISEVYEMLGLEYKE